MNKFKDLIFYEIYPTSFYDSNGDGIGDLKGITLKLEYVKNLGFNAIWFNPFYVSPFKDGGYDVKDFFDIDPKFGTLNDFDEMLKKSHELGIKVIVDLIAGHASNENPIFLESSKAQRNEYSDLFIWTDSVWNSTHEMLLVRGLTERDSGYAVNFFSSQPAFNYGFNEVREPWEMSYKDPRTFVAREYLLKIMRFWLNRGVDGFRVDMASYLVKNDDEHSTANIEVWNYLFNQIKKEYKDKIFISEWGFTPDRPFKAGFDCDFRLLNESNYLSYLIRNEHKVLDNQNIDKFIELLNKDLNWAKEFNGLLGNISGNHDTIRIANDLSIKELKSYYMFILSMPGIPFIYYGDEIGMKSPTLVSKDGGYFRTGSRTPMQWDLSKNAGFSDTNGELYLPTLLGNNANVNDNLKDKNSLYYFIKKMIEIRKEYKSLRDDEIEIKEKDGLISIIHKDLIYMLNVGDKIYPIEKDKIVISNLDNPNELGNKEAVIIKR